MILSGQISERSENTDVPMYACSREGGGGGGGARVRFCADGRNDSVGRKTFDAFSEGTRPF